MLVAQIIPAQAAVAQLLVGVALQLPFATLGQPSQPQRHLALAAQLIVQFATERGGAGATEVDAVAADRLDEALFQWRAIVEEDEIQRFEPAVDGLQIGTEERR